MKSDETIDKKKQDLLLNYSNNKKAWTILTHIRLCQK